MFHKNSYLVALCSWSSVKKNQERYFAKSLWFFLKKYFSLKWRGGGFWKKNPLIGVAIYIKTFLQK